MNRHHGSDGTPRPGRTPRPRLGRRVVRGLGLLLRARDGNLLLASETNERTARDDYRRAVAYLERLVTWARKGGAHATQNERK